MNCETNRIMATSLQRIRWRISRISKALLVTTFLVILSRIPGMNGSPCGQPPVPLNAKVSLTSPTLEVNTNATYSCDPGYELFGKNVLSCTEQGRWRGELPFCAVDVAYRKPANQSTTTRGGDAANANDGNLSTLHDGKYCSETRRETSPWWRVDLLRAYDIRVIRVLTPTCCGQQSLQDVEIRVGNSTSISRNKLCAWYPGSMEQGERRDFSCARATVGRYVFIQMVGVEGALSLCEVQVFTTQELSRERCAAHTSGEIVRSFDQNCYEFQTGKGSDFRGARKYCQERHGDLVHRINNVTKNFLMGELDLVKKSMSTQLVWIGAIKEPGLVARTWHWVDGSVVLNHMWGPDQPNNYNGEQNCVVLDGGRGWLWNDVGCNLNYLPWVCQFAPPSCGSPDKHVNTTIDGGDYSVGQIIAYRCPKDSVVIGNITRFCQRGGHWSGQPPTCKYVDCGSLHNISNGEVILVNNRTTYGARVTYRCAENYTLLGDEARTCAADGKWSGKTPSCLYHFCPEPFKPINSTVDLSGVTAGSTATYRCDWGHVLHGDQEIQCQLGGKWTGVAPTCTYLDCGQPNQIKNGVFILPHNNSTLYRSEVLYTCNSESYELQGTSRRECVENGTWTGVDPYCSMVSCPEPDVNPGSYIVVDTHQFSVWTVVDYSCDPGHDMEGDRNRTCGSDGNWSGEAPKCKFVDCGHVQPVFHGQVDYINSTTYLGSIVVYSCAPGYRVKGESNRTCENSGKWKGTTPVCEEIRCNEPERPPNTVLSISGNDRAADGDSYKIGSTAQFRCEKGYKLVGVLQQMCDTEGKWTEAPPSCLYVDCHYPEPISNGEIALTTNTTYFGSVAQYRCNDRFELIGRGLRTCLDNATWEGSPPACHEISCGAPDKPPSVLAIDVSAFTVDNVASYRCVQGQQIKGEPKRVCQRDGKWSGEAPTCQWVDCGRPLSPQNGEIYLLNHSTTFQSVMEYHCFFGYKLNGPASRWCTEGGFWSGKNGTCELDNMNEDVFNERSNKAITIDGQAQDEIVMSKTIGVAIGVGAGGVLLLTIIIALVYMKVRRAKPMQGSESMQVDDSNKRSPTIPAYAMQVETDLSDSGATDGSSPHHSHGSSSSNHQSPFTVNNQHKHHHHHHPPNSHYTNGNVTFGNGNLRNQPDSDSLTSSRTPTPPPPEELPVHHHRPAPTAVPIPQIPQNPPRPPSRPHPPRPQFPPPAGPMHRTALTNARMNTAMNGGNMSQR